jgi:hypothetical protein
VLVLLDQALLGLRLYAAIVGLLLLIGLCIGELVKKFCDR